MTYGFAGYVIHVGTWGPQVLLDDATLASMPPAELEALCADVLDGWQRELRRAG